MKKRRPRARNYSPLQKLYSHYTYERFPNRARNTYDSKECKRSHIKQQHENNGFDDNTCLKQNVFDSLESLFDLKKFLNLRDVYSLAFDYYKEKLSSQAPNFMKSELLVETLFLQSTSPRTTLKGHIFKSYDEYDRIEVEQNATDQSKTNKEENFQTEISESVQELQQNDLIPNRQKFSKNMAESEILNDEIPEKQEEKLVEDSITIDEKSAIKTENSTKDENGKEEEDKDEDKREDKDKDKDENNPFVKVEEDKIDNKNIEDDKDNKEILKENKSQENPSSLRVNAEDIHDNVTKSDGSIKQIINSPTGDIITELNVMSEKCITLEEEIQQLKREVGELSQKSELTEEDALVIQEKQDILMSKIAELEQLTQKLQKAREEVERIGDLNGEVKEVTEEEKRNIKSPRRIMEEDRFELPGIEYPEDKLPRVIICGYTDNMLPKIVIADSERKRREKRFEKLSGKLTESLTMQEKLVKENAQLEGGKYKLEEALLEKDTALENLQRKVCSLQAEMRVIVKENTELSRQLATLVTRSTCHYTCPGISPSSQSMLPSVSLRPHIHTPRDDAYCRCECCLQSQFADTPSPTTETACNSPRLTGGGSTTEEQYFADRNALQNIKMCSRGPVVVKPPRSGCPAELEDKLTTYGASTKQLEQQLGSMETEIHNMQMELANVQKERQQLEQQRKLLKCAGPCAPCACCPLPPTSICMTPTPGLPLTSISPKAPVIPAVPPVQGINAQQQLRDLREQYARLQDDYKSKLCEVSCMRTDAEKLKQDSRDAKEEKERIEIKLIDAQERLKLLEMEKEKLDGHKEQLIEQEQALMVAKQRFREAQDELEELRSLIQDQATQLEDYRNKYLKAQQQVEEQRRQLDLMEMDNARMNENVTLEIGRVKNQFQEKLAELAPLPDILKQMQVKMQEAQQMRLVAERNYEDLSRELLGSKDKIQTLQNQLDVLRTEYQTLQDEMEHETSKFEEMEKKYCELRHENERMKNTLARFEEQEAQLQKRIEEKMHENMQLSSMLEQIREDSARQVVRTKERCETMRRSMQGQITEMERQLAQCRATARAAQKDRDEIRQKMQSQINNLNEEFKHAQGRIKSLQGHVNYLKTSYSNIFLGQGETPTGALPADDSCDCTY